MCWKNFLTNLFVFGELIVPSNFKPNWKYLVVGFSTLCFLNQPSAWAGVYKWTDEKGRTHYTDDRSQIPAKYRDKNTMKGLKGLVESKPVAPKTSSPAKPAAKAEENTEALAPEAKESSSDQAVGTTNSSSQISPEEIAMLKETKKYLEDENREFQRIIKYVEPTEANGKYYVMEMNNRVKKKQEMVKKMDGMKLSSLQQAKSYFKRTIIMDKGETIGGEDYLDRIVNIRDKMERGLREKKNLIKELDKDLKAVDASNVQAAAGK